MSTEQIFQSRRTRVYVLKTYPLNNNPKGMYSYGYFRLWKGFIIMVRFILVLAIRTEEKSSDT